MPLLPLLLNNWQIIAKAIGVAIVAFLCWWFFIHNPKVIKQLEDEKRVAIEQKDAAFAAINMLTEIERAKDVVTKTSFKIISSIRYVPKPSRDGLFYSNADPSGLLQPVFKTYTAKGRTASSVTHN